MEFLPFFLVLMAAVFFSELFQRLHLPWVVALILGGVIIGPSVLGWLEPVGFIDFLGQIGLIFLMFIAGLEIRLSGFKQNWQDVTAVSILNSGIPFLAGFGIAWFFGMGLEASILLGIIFISSAVAVSIPSLESNKLLGTGAGKLVTSVTVFEDIFSLVLLALFLQIVVGSPGEGLPIVLFFILFILSVVVLRLVVPKIQWLLSLNQPADESSERSFLSIFAILIGTVVIFELLGLHPIVGGFFAGLILSDSLVNPVLRDRIRTISYGLFIPIFFIVIGAKTDIWIFHELTGVILLTVLVIIGSIVSKFVSGYLGGRLLGFSNTESSLIGVATIPQLSITLAVAFTGVELGILNENLATALVALTIVTTFSAPIIIRSIARRMNIRVV